MLACAKHIAAYGTAEGVDMDMWDGAFMELDGAGDEAVQLYVRDLVAGVSRPVKELKGFRRISLDPGETKRVTFTLTPRDLAVWTAKHGWITEPAPRRPGSKSLRLSERTPAGVFSARPERKAMAHPLR